MNRVIRWGLFLAAIGALFLGCQASEQADDGDLIRIEAADDGPELEPKTEEAVASGSGSGKNPPKGQGSGRLNGTSNPTVVSRPSAVSSSSLVVNSRGTAGTAPSSSEGSRTTPGGTGAGSSSGSAKSSAGKKQESTTSKKSSGIAATRQEATTPVNETKSGDDREKDLRPKGEPSGTADNNPDSDRASDTGGDTESGTDSQSSSESGNGSADTSNTTTSKPKVITTAEPTTTSSSTTRSAASSASGLTLGYDASPPDPGWSKPSVGQTYSDPKYGTKLRRATSAAGTRFNRNDYSRRQAENANGSYFMTYHGAARFDVYTVNSLELVRSLSVHPGGEPQWHPTNPSLIRHLAGDNASVGELRLYETNVQTGEKKVIADLTSRIQAEFPTAKYIEDRNEGSPSRDGNRYAWLIYDGNERQIGIVSYDLASDRILGTTSDLGGSLVDWSGYSVNGKYVLGGSLSGTYAWDADMTNRRVVTTATEHSDLALDRSGNDAYVYIDFKTGSPTAGWLVSVDLATLERTKIFDVYDDANTSIHISGRGFEKPGWVIVSTYNCKDPGAWTCEKVMAVELAPNGRVVNLAHTYNCGNQYWTETHASVNRSFTRVYFNSDGGSCGIDAEVYQLQVPNFS